MRFLAGALLLVACMDTHSVPVPSCPDGASFAVCDDRHGAFCAGGFDPDDPHYVLPGTTRAECDFDGALQCRNGAEPYCEERPDPPDGG